MNPESYIIKCGGEINTSTIYCRITFPADVDHLIKDELLYSVSHDGKVTKGTEFDVIIIQRSDWVDIYADTVSIVVNMDELFLELI